MDIVPSYSKLKSERFKTALKVVRTYGKTCRNSMTRQFIILMRYFSIKTGEINLLITKI